MSTVPVAKSTIGHHLHVLRAAGVIRTRLDGASRISELHRDDLQQRFPGFVDTVVNATPPSQQG